MAPLDHSNAATNDWFANAGSRGLAFNLSSTVAAIAEANTAALCLMSLGAIALLTMRRRADVKVDARMGRLQASAALRWHRPGAL
ncbi:hypothetical protein [Nitrococcus mobilis]|uniref:Uncharacterized protein n=1 Tax=Nitrococcus mobilis Nb-231 TaxID=314278 RepID=A4BVE7_9GAMM|nr:hypothetical protein [Nitrococcus mobilis]EAR20332.1 hypothetical protein NB231_03030 [Nitrococcus mobilis Nb-231]